MGRIDEKMFFNRLPSNEQAKSHHVAIHQSQFNRPALATQFQKGMDERPFRDRAVRSFDFAMIHHFGFGFNLRIQIFLFGMDDKTDFLFFSRRNHFHFGGVQSGGPRPRINFCFDLFDPQLWQGNPLSPAENLFCFFHFGHRNIFLLDFIIFQT